MHFGLWFFLSELFQTWFKNGSWIVPQIPHPSTQKCACILCENSEMEKECQNIINDMQFY